MEGTPRKVRSACERCRKQKLKCDIQRPCMLCMRANAECIAPPTERWKFHHHNQSEASPRDGRPSTKRRRLRAVRSESTPGPAPPPEDEIVQSPLIVNSSPLGAHEDDIGGHDNVAEDEGAAWNASSTITLVEEAFHHHEVPSPEETETSALLASNWARSKPRSSSHRQSQGAPSPLQQMLSQNIRNHRTTLRNHSSHVAGKELLSLLPDLEIATLLIDNYFTRIHWFTLIFHQRDFRIKFRDLYGLGPRPPNEAVQTRSRVGFTAVLLAVFATSLQYINTEQRGLLLGQGFEPDSSKDKILMGLKLRFLDILSLGSLEVVQMCILLGSYYMYAGEPELAWPLCGSGLRIAQAINLHRKVPANNWNDESVRLVIEDRKRAWWAIYEIETFCSMLYGFPLSITDSDCDVAPLNPNDECSDSMLTDQNATIPNLLLFKCSMSELSAIVKSTLDSLYGTRSDNTQHGENRATHLNSLLKNVTSLNSRLLKWKEKLPPKLTTNGPNTTINTDPETLNEFDEHLFRLQALSLKLAYENTRILIHRPLLSFRMRRLRTASQQGSDGPDLFQTAMRTCREAALQISQNELIKYFEEASETYAVSFVSLHLLTAAVTLCISITLGPLSLEAYESRMGIRRLMQIQSLLKDKSVIAAQGLDITRRLMALVMAKEVEAMFEVEPPTKMTQQRSPSNSRRMSQRRHVNPEHVEDTQEQHPTIAATVFDATSQPLGDPTTESEAMNAIFDSQFYEFYENTFMADAVSQYEQAINVSPNVDITNEPSTLDQQDLFMGTTSFGQEQGWIWSWNF